MSRRPHSISSPANRPSPCILERVTNKRGYRMSFGRALSGSLITVPILLAKRVKTGPSLFEPEREQNVALRAQPSRSALTTYSGMRLEKFLWERPSGLRLRRSHPSSRGGFLDAG